MKKWYQKLSHPWAKSAAGFTLVELVVVIAIMGILGGVGTLGYSQYITAAHKNNDKTVVGNVVRALDTANNSHLLDFGVEGQYSEGLEIPVGFVVLSNTPYADNTFVKTIVPDSENNPIDTALSAAYGAEYATTMQLQYGEWDDITYASFYTEAGNLLEKVQIMGDEVLGLLHNRLLRSYYSNGGITVRGSTVQVISRDYTNSADLVDALADEIKLVNRNTFIEKWAKLTSEGSEGFGLPAKREMYAAVRGAYSQCFGNYVKSAGNHGNCGNHADAIIAYGESGGDIIKSKFSGLAGTIIGGIVDGISDVTFPMAVCGESFEATRTENPSQFKQCKECYDLWANGYYDSDQARADAAAFYDLMVTATTYDTEAEGADIFDWAGEQAEMFEAMYGDLTEYTANRSAVAVAVYHNKETNLLKIEVQPIIADPRNEG